MERTTRIAISLAALIGLSMMSACEEAKRIPDCGIEFARQAIVFGKDSIAGLTETERNAIGKIEIPISESFTRLCSGFLVAPRWFMTARHCLADIEASSSSQVRVLFGAKPPNVTLGVLNWSLHPDADFALVELETASTIAPLRYARYLPEEFSVEAAAIAGYGLTETGRNGELRFAVEDVVEVNASEIRVRGVGFETGACAGDSGGPLFALGGRVPVVLGILSKGSDICLGIDVYVRLDAVGDWIEAVAEPGFVVCR
jgi:hypothetical protein